MAMDPKGFFHLGDDGVYRSFSGDGTVIDYERLAPSQILDSFTYYSESEKKTLQKEYADVDGTKVVDEEQILRPKEHLRPFLLRKRQSVNKIKREDAKIILERVFNLKKRSCSYTCEENEDCYPHDCYGCVQVDRKEYAGCVQGRPPSK